MTKDVSTARSRDLGQQLARVRQSVGFSTMSLADMIGTGTPTLSRLEHGLRGVSDVKLIQYLSLCGLKSDEIVPYLQLSHMPDTGYHISAFDGRVADELVALVVHETTAGAIEEYETTYIPGLLQSRNYTRALLHVSGIETKEVIERGVQVRTDRQDIFRRKFPPQTTFYLSENALRATVGGPQIMHDQMMKLLFAGNFGDCSIRVVPAARLGETGTNGSFRLMSYIEHRSVASQDLLTATVFLEKPHDIALYRGALKRIDRVALDEGQSRSLIATMADEYGRQGAEQDARGITGDVDDMAEE